MVMGMGYGAYETFSVSQETVSIQLAQTDTTIEKANTKEEKKETIKIPPPSIDRMKKEGCIVDGLLSGYGDDESNIEMAKRLPCYSMHRALETWLEPPDFDQAQSFIEKIGKTDVVWGMFLAEAIHLKSDYLYEKENRNFSFYDMCAPDTKNKWGEHTCVPSLEKKEYRLYLEQITARAMDIGIQNFMFGQVFLQDDTKKTRIPQIITFMRDAAKSRNIEIVIGAQTNDITDPEYLKMFDYIEGGVGLYANGKVENKPCFSRWWKKEGDWCWALLWHEQYVTNAHNVLVHLDWSGKHGDDMSTFARMDSKDRAKTLQSLYDKFREQKIGFLLPVMTALPENNGGCYGEKERYYSASKDFGCKDEEHISKIIQSS